MNADGVGYIDVVLDLPDSACTGTSYMFENHARVSITENDRDIPSFFPLKDPTAFAPAPLGTDTNASNDDVGTWYESLELNTDE